MGLLAEAASSLGVKEPQKACGVVLGWHRQPLISVDAHIELASLQSSQDYEHPLLGYPKESSQLKEFR